MIALIQRVSTASVTVDGKIIGQIEQGILALIGIENEDSQTSVDNMIKKLLKYRVFCDENDKMNQSLEDIQGGLLLVPQFTLAADTRKGLRPSFSSAAPPAQAEALFANLLLKIQSCYKPVACGQFGADMKVSLTNDGPVTFWLQVP